jgi:hypothetical protein
VIENTQITTVYYQKSSESSTYATRYKKIQFATNLKVPSVDLLNELIRVIVERIIGLTSPDEFPRRSLSKLQRRDLPSFGTALSTLRMLGEDAE